jgi:hypothetical protein
VDSDRERQQAPYSHQPPLRYSWSVILVCETLGWFQLPTNSGEGESRCNTLSHEGSTLCFDEEELVCHTGNDLYEGISTCLRSIDFYLGEEKGPARATIVTCQMRLALHTILFSLLRHPHIISQHTSCRPSLLASLLNKEE